MCGLFSYYGSNFSNRIVVERVITHRQFWQGQHEPIFLDLPLCHCHHHHCHCHHYLHWGKATHHFLVPVLEIKFKNLISIIMNQIYEHIQRAASTLPKHVSFNIWHFVKSTREVANLSSHWFVTSIWPSALKQFEWCKGSFTALICFDSMIDEHKPFGAPKAQMRAR